MISLIFTRELPGFLESIQAIHASEATLGTAVEKAIKVIEGRDPDTYIEPAFKPTEEVEDFTLKEVKKHILRTGKDSHDVSIRDEDVALQKIALNEEKGIFDLQGYANSIRQAQTAFDRPKRTVWSWEMSIDARTGRILSKSIVSQGSLVI